MRTLTTSDTAETNIFPSPIVPSSPLRAVATIASITASFWSSFTTVEIIVFGTDGAGDHLPTSAGEDFYTLLLPAPSDVGVAIALATGLDHSFKHNIDPFWAYKLPLF